MARDLQLVVVTPEQTLFDEPVSGLRFPLYDGQIGVLPGRAPLVGRLGAGELSVNTASGVRSYFLDGGFVQINGGTVTLLTSRCLSAGDIDAGEVNRQLENALSRPAANDAEIAARFQDQERARRMLAVKSS